MSFQDLLNRDRSVTIHHRHIQKLGIEVYKAKNNLSPTVSTYKKYSQKGIKMVLISK